MNHETINSEPSSTAEQWERLGEEAPSFAESYENESNTAEQSGEQDDQEKIIKARAAVMELFNKPDTAEAAAATAEQPVIVSAPEPKKKSALNTVGRAAKATGHGLLMTAACGGIAFAPYLAPVLLPVAILEGGSMKHNVNGVNGSMFEVDHKGKITQNVNPIPALIRNRGKSQSEIFVDEAQKLFDGLEPGKTYSTRSHAITYKMLQKMQSEGKIENLTCEEDGTSRLIMESLATKNFKSILKGKKRKMFKISFNVKEKLPENNQNQ